MLVFLAHAAHELNLFLHCAEYYRHIITVRRFNLVSILFGEFANLGFGEGFNLMNFPSGQQALGRMRFLVEPIFQKNVQV